MEMGLQIKSKTKCKNSIISQDQNLRLVSCLSHSNVISTHGSSIQCKYTSASDETKCKNEL